MRQGAERGGLRPFIKWAGGKTQLLEAYAPLLPRIPDLATYHEPFIGSGAVFLNLREQGAIPGKAMLSDLNEHLITAWTIVRDEPKALAAKLARLQAKHSSEAYYEARERYNTGRLAPLERAALLVYLNRAGFNGLYRVNSKGHFNVPLGRTSNGGALKLPSEAMLQRCSAALQGVLLIHAPFISVLDRARGGDLVYFDPPYVPISTTSAFTSYACDGFGMAEQELLRDVFAQLDARGCKVMLSNSASFAVLKLYQGWDIVQVPARRSINSNADSRGAVNEVVIRNYTS